MSAYDYCLVLTDPCDEVDVSRIPLYSDVTLRVCYVVETVRYGRIREVSLV